MKKKLSIGIGVLAAALAVACGVVGFFVFSAKMEIERLASDTAAQQSTAASEQTLLDEATLTNTHLSAEQAALTQTLETALETNESDRAAAELMEWRAFAEYQCLLSITIEDTVWELRRVINQIYDIDMEAIYSVDVYAEYVYEIANADSMYRQYAELFEQRMAGTGQAVKSQDDLMEELEEYWYSEGTAEITPDPIIVEMWTNEQTDHLAELTEKMAGLQSALEDDFNAWKDEWES